MFSPCILRAIFFLNMGNTKIAKVRFEGGQWVAFWNEDVYSQYIDSSVDTSNFKQDDTVSIEIRLASVESNDENRYRAFLI